MNVDNFNLILSNIKETKKYIELVDSNCKVATYHIILNNDQTKFEVAEYKKNVINETKSIAYIWKMHNWSGNYAIKNPRTKTKRKSCGRPSAPTLTIRAGGEKGRTAAVVPCCQVLGPPNEEKSILGHLDKSSFEEVYFGEKYEKLRKAHDKNDFDSIDYYMDYLVSHV